MVVQMAGEGVRRLRQKLGPEHGTTVPSRLCVYLDLDALFLVLGWDVWRQYSAHVSFNGVALRTGRVHELAPESEPRRSRLALGCQIRKSQE